MTQSNALEERQPSYYVNHPQVAEAIKHLEAADVALCRVVAALAVARGWKEDEPYKATRLEQWWHDRIRELGGLRDRLQDPT